MSEISVPTHVHYPKTFYRGRESLFVIHKHTGQTIAIYDCDCGKKICYGFRAINGIVVEGYYEYEPKVG